MREIRSVRLAAAFIFEGKKIDFTLGIRVTAITRIALILALTAVRLTTNLLAATA